MKFEDMLNNILLGDSYKLIKDIPDESINLIYTDIPYLYSGGYNKHQNNCGVGINQKLADSLSNIINGIDYSILDEFDRVSKIGNIFIWCSREQIKDIINFYSERKYYFDILVWCKTNPQPLAQNSFLSDIEYCLYFRKKGVSLNDGYELKRKWDLTPINKADKDKYKHPTIKPLNLVKRHIEHTTQKK